MNTHIPRTASAVLTLCAAVPIIACHAGSPSSAAISSAIPTAKVIAAQRGNLSEVLTLAGQFQPYQVVDVHPKVSGYMSHINVDIGDMVRQGQTLAVLEVPELTAQLQGSAYDVEQSKEEATRAQHEIDRTEALYAALHVASERLKKADVAHPGLIAQQELDDAQAKDLAAQAQVESAKAALAAALQHGNVARSNNQGVQAMEDYTHVAAPLSGVVVWRYADTGALIQGGTSSNSQTLPIVRLAQIDILRLRIAVPEDDVRYVHLGDSLEVRLDAIGRSLTGKIVRFTHEVNFETRAMEIEVDVENKDFSISPGMYANTALTLGHVENVVTVPVEALALNGQNQTVEVIDNTNRVHLRTVQIGLRGSKLAEITSGLNVGDRVIIGGKSKYFEDEEVEPMLTTAPASETVQVTGGMIHMNAAQTGFEQKDGDAR